MSFVKDLQAVCDQHNVKLAPGLALSQDQQSVHATLMAYKLDANGKTEKQVDLKQVAPKKVETK